ncbi:hypothetical protein PVAP13_8NG266000 [Panicum virgatum]|uniref:Uncharacterized protein n=1 Tax=Panicum virgatum TaxID=38727 RepID=A0A8T0PBS9_PANVG|nr:hypothetical protein PVAP13_8NG266000 [Panicum virgatum]KAG2558429.1 hypothetical protein PVAP13_8NG266000 [Panicum virgatum]
MEVTASDDHNHYPKRQRTSGAFAEASMGTSPVRPWWYSDAGDYWVLSGGLLQHELRVLCRDSRVLLDVHFY